MIIRRHAMTAITALLIVGATAGPAAANHLPGYPDGPNHAFGEMVAYSLAFPVGSGHSYGAGSDSFIFRVGERITEVQDLAPKTRDYLDRGKIYLHYGEYAKYRRKIKMND